VPDFYEEDEPIEKIEAAFERGEKVMTARPRGQTVYLDVPASGPLLWSSDGTWTT
jgi:hypothetical protein